MTRSIARRTVWGAVAAVSGAALSSYFTFDVPLAVTLGLAALCALALWRPFEALLVFVGLSGVAVTVQGLAGGGYSSPFALAQAALFVLVAAVASRAAVRGDRLRLSPLDLSLLGFAAVCVASALSLLPTLFLRMGVESIEGARQLLPPAQFFAWLPGTPVIDHTMLVVEGIALALLTRRAISNHHVRAERVLMMFLAGAAAAAALNVIRFLEILVRQEDPVAAIVPALVGLRLNTQFGDVNAAGSLFAMAAVLCAGYSGLHSIRQAVLLALMPLFACALWITGSRVAMVTTLLCLLVVVARRVGSGGWPRMARHATKVGAIVVLMAVAAIFVFKTARHGSLSFSTSTRVQLLTVGLEMARERPITGIGISQFYARFPEFAPAELLAAFKDATGREILNENAHNQFVQYLAELGVVGLAFFVLGLWLALSTGSPAPVWRAATLAAIAAFLLTCLAGHPLLTRGVAYPFWILLAVAASGAPALAQTPERWLRRTVIALVVVLAATLPARWRSERSTARLEHATLGMSQADRDEFGERFQWAGRRATVFVNGVAGVVRLPLRSPDGQPRRVTILLDGTPADVVTVSPGGWQRVRILLPASDDAPAFRRLDLEVDPAPGLPGERLLMVGRAVTP